MPNTDPISTTLDAWDALEPPKQPHHSSCAALRARGVFHRGLPCACGGPHADRTRHAQPCAKKARRIEKTKGRKRDGGTDTRQEAEGISTAHNTQHMATVWLPHYTLGNEDPTAPPAARTALGAAPLMSATDAAWRSAPICKRNSITPADSIYHLSDQRSCSKPCTSFHNIIRPRNGHDEQDGGQALRQMF